MRPWVLLRAFDIPFSEHFLRLDENFASRIAAISPAGQVPVLRDGATVVWDSLAIAEYLAELFPRKHLWPQNSAQRAQARSMCAQMHSGFSQLRTHCGMNIAADLRAIGQVQYEKEAGVRADVAQLQQLWDGALAHSQGPYLFGDFSIADAYFAPTLLRLKTYGLPLHGRALDWSVNLLAHPAVQAWVAAARAEADFLPAYEPYRSNPATHG